MLLGYISLIIGLFIAIGMLFTSPYAFGFKWSAWIAMFVAGLINVIIGIWVIRKKHKQ